MENLENFINSASTDPALTSANDLTSNLTSTLTFTSSPNSWLQECFPNTTVSQTDSFYTDWSNHTDFEDSNSASVTSPVMTDLSNVTFDPTSHINEVWDNSQDPMDAMMTSSYMGDTLLQNPNLTPQPLTDDLDQIADLILFNPKITPEVTAQSKEVQDEGIALPKEEQKPVKEVKRRTSPRRKRRTKQVRRHSYNDSGFDSTSSESDEEEVEEKKVQRKANGSGIPKAKITLWMLRHLESEEYNPSVITWKDKRQGLFQITDQAELAKLWGLAKKNPRMNYDKFSRAMRYYYKTKELKIVRKKLIYQFGERSPFFTGRK